MMFNTCHHCLCVECFVSYVESKVRSRDFIQCENIGYTVKCPGKIIAPRIHNLVDTILCSVVRTKQIQIGCE